MEMSLNQGSKISGVLDPVYLIWAAFGNYLEARKVKLMSQKIYFI